MRIRFLNVHPPTVFRRGGGEYELQKTISVLRARGIDAAPFDLSRPFDGDLLHLVGSGNVNCEVGLEALSVNIPVVVNSICYTHRPDVAWRLARRSATLCGRPSRFDLRMRLFANADRVLSSSAAEVELLRSRYDAPVGRTEVYRLGAERPPWGPERLASLDERSGSVLDGEFALQVGRISEHKGQLITAEACRGLDLPLVIVGAPSDDEYWLRLQNVMVGKGSPIVVLRHVRHDSGILAELYSRASLHCLPSISECPGLVNLEAGAAGCMVVTSDLSPTREYVGEHAVYVPDRSVASVRSGIERALDNQEDGAAIADHLAEFTWDRLARSLVDMYVDVLARRSEGYMRNDGPLC